MKTRHFFSQLLMISSMIIPLNLSGQGNEQGKPEIRWDVNREFDENGNILRYDSTYTYYWKSPGMDDFNYDSLFFNFPSFFWKGPYGNHFDFDSLFSEYHEFFPDPFDEGFFFDFPFGHDPYIFSIPGFPDMDEFTPFNHPFFFSDSLLNMPFQDPFYNGSYIRRYFDWPSNDSIHSWHHAPLPFSDPFPGFEEFFNERNEMIEKYFNEHPFYMDTIPHTPNRYIPPDTRKKPFKEIDI